MSQIQPVGLRLEMKCPTPQGTIPYSILGPREERSEKIKPPSTIATTAIAGEYEEESKEKEEEEEEKDEEEEEEEEVTTRTAERLGERLVKEIPSPPPILSPGEVPVIGWNILRLNGKRLKLI